MEMPLFRGDMIQFYKFFTSHDDTEISKWKGDHGDDKEIKKVMQSGCKKTLIQLFGY